MHRRTFLKSLAWSSAAVFARPRAALAADTEIDIALDTPGAVIRPEVYGHFVEHLGGVIYDGIWVGPGSKIPNVDGLRRQFVDDMKRIGAPALRWPGGCFADGYHWRDGIGASARRPRTFNFWERSMPAGVHATETNQFGIHEFMRLCRLTGAEPYLAGNVGSSTPREFHEWVSYCNAPAGTESLADERAANGSRDPFGVKYWGVGNESWGCGGDMAPGEYAAQYRKFVTQFPVYTPPFLVAAGPRGHSKDMDLAWTTGFFEGLQGHRTPLDGFALHFYTDFRNDPMSVTTFTPAEWYAVLIEGLRTEEVVEAHWRAMGALDPDHKTKLVVDEWGVWYKPGEEIGPAYILSQPVTLRDALHTAITFDIFNRHADKIAMANVAQTINCIHSLFLAREDRYTRTPPYYVFELYKPHMGARSVPLRVLADEVPVPARQGTARMPAVSASASQRDRRVLVTVTNPLADQPQTVRLRLSGGARVTQARGQMLTHEDMHARNTFERPGEVALAALAVTVTGAGADVQLPAHAVAAVELVVA